MSSQSMKKTSKTVIKRSILPWNQKLFLRRGVQACKLPNEDLLEAEIEARPEVALDRYSLNKYCDKL